jgi:hypothetical protein
MPFFANPCLSVFLNQQSNEKEKFTKSLESLTHSGLKRILPLWHSCRYKALKTEPSQGSGEGCSRRLRYSHASMSPLYDKPKSKGEKTMTYRFQPLWFLTFVLTTLIFMGCAKTIKPMDALVRDQSDLSTQDYGLVPHHSPQNDPVQKLYDKGQADGFLRNIDVYRVDENAETVSISTFLPNSIRPVENALVNFQDGRIYFSVPSVKFQPDTYNEDGLSTVVPLLRVKW